MKKYWFERELPKSQNDLIRWFRRPGALAAGAVVFIYPLSKQTGNDEKLYF
jgi:hypothetical protein